MRQYLKIQKETTYNVPDTSGTAIWLELGESDATIDAIPSMFTVRGARPSRGVVDIHMGSTQYAVSGQITTQLYHEQANFWHEAVFEPTVTSNIPNLPSYTIYRSYVSNAGVSRVERFSGVKFASASLSGSSAGNQAPVAMQLSLVGSQWTDTGITLAAPACVDFPTQLYLWPMTDLVLGGISLKGSMRSASISITHNMNPVFHVNPYPDRISYFGWTPSISTQLDLDSHAFTSKYQSILTSFDSAKYATNNKLEFTFAADKKVTFDLYNAYFTQLGTTRPPGGDFMQSGTIQTKYDCTNLDVTCTITNPA